MNPRDNALKPPGTRSEALQDALTAVTLLKEKGAKVGLYTDTMGIMGFSAGGSPFTYQITASNSPTSFNASGLPEGLVVNPLTGLIAGTPTITGTFLVTLYATNSSNQTVTSNLTLTISGVDSTDTPTLPSWGLAVLTALLVGCAGLGLRKTAST